MKKLTIFLLCGFIVKSSLSQSNNSGLVFGKYKGFEKVFYKLEGDTPIIGFSPRKAEFSLYVYTPSNDNKKLLAQLGKFKMGKACIYFKKLIDLNLDILEKLSKSTIEYINENHECDACK
jgi:hypothetical protein